MPRQHPRRTFLRRAGGAAALAAASSAASSPALAAVPAARFAAWPAVLPGGSLSSDDRVVLATIGCGGRGSTLTRDFVARKDVVVAAVCDADSRRTGTLARDIAAATGRAPLEFTDYRRALDQKDVHAVIVATPDHWHALPTVHACQASKDVYVEKPASYSIWDGRKMVEAARKYDRVVQVGLQNRSAPENRKALELIRSGALGTIHLCRVSNLKDGGPFRTPADGDPPADVDYDAWLGPAPKRPFNAGHFHGGWYYFFAYCGGDMGNDSSHQLDLARWLIDRDYPRTAYSTGGRHVFKDARDVPDTQVATFEYEDLTMTFELTQWAPYMDKIAGDVRTGDLFPYWPQCATRIELYGSKALMMLGRHGGGWQVFVGSDPKSRPGKVVAEEYGRIPDAPHKEDFIQCVRARKRPNADIEEGHHSAVLSHLGNISYRLGGRKLALDPATETIVGDDEANRLVRPPCREPYRIPDPV